MASSLGRIEPTKGPSARYQRVVAGAIGAFDTRAMFDALPALLVVAALIDGSVLYGMQVARRVHQRRIDDRLLDAAHMHGRVRITLAQRRTA